MPGRPAAVITGGTSGIGRATALHLADRGFDIGFTYRANDEAAAVTAEQIRAQGSVAVAVRADFTDAEAAGSAVAAVVQGLGRVDVLVNNAGVNRRAPMLEESLSGWSDTLSVNLLSPWACARAAAEHMIATGSGGRIINVTSVLATHPLYGGSAYCAAKAGLEMLTKVMALELAPHGVIVNSVAPGHTATPMNFSKSDLDDRATVLPVVPVGRSGEAEEIAEMIGFLATCRGTYASGASLLVDGGLALVSGPESLARVSPPHQGATRSTVG